MAVINIKVVVSNLDEVREIFDRIKIHRAIAGEDGPYVEITDASTRLVLEAGKIIYEYQDLAGDADYWYRSSYFNSTSSLESSLSDPQQGEGDSALDIIGVDELKTLYLFGLDLTDDAGTPYPDSIYEHAIKAATTWLEQKLDIPIRPVAVAENHDFYREDFYKFMALYLDKYPVIEVQDVTLSLPGGAVVRTYDGDWLRVMKEAGQVHIVPGADSAGIPLIGAAGSWFPMVFSYNDFIPDAFEVRYTAGFESGQVPASIKDLIGKIASFAPLNIAGDLLGGAGIASQSVSIDGLSQNFNTTSSATNAGYGARILQYGKEIKDMVPTLQRYYKGIRIAIA